MCEVQIIWQFLSLHIIVVVEAATVTTICKFCCMSVKM